DLRGLAADMGPPTPPPDPIDLERQKQEAEALRKEHVTAVKELAFREFLGNLVKENVKPAWPVPPPKPAARGPRKAHERTPLLTLTDWHFEEKVSSAGVLGLNSYDIPTACRRVHRIVSACRDWKQDFEAAGRFRLPSLTIALMGDFLTGTLHGLERHTDAP